MALLPPMTAVQPSDTSTTAGQRKADKSRFLRSFAFERVQGRSTAFWLWILAWPVESLTSLLRYHRPNLFIMK